MGMRILRPGYIGPLVSEYIEERLTAAFIIIIDTLPTNLNVKLRVNR